MISIMSVYLDSLFPARSRDIEADVQAFLEVKRHQCRIRVQSSVVSL